MELKKSYDPGVKLLDVSTKEHKSGISDHSTVYGEEAADNLDGVVRFEEGEGVDVLLSGEEQHVTIGKTEVDAEGAPTGNVSVTLADGRVVSMSKEEVQAATSALDEARKRKASTNLDNGKESVNLQPEEETASDGNRPKQNTNRVDICQDGSGVAADRSEAKKSRH